MVHFYTALSRGALFLACAVSMYTPSKALKGTVPINMNLIKNFIHSYIQPFLDKAKGGVENLRRYSSEDDELNAIIKSKVSELKDVLEDEQFAIPAKEDEFTLEGEETTIIEIMTQNTSSRRTLQDINDKQRNLKSHMLKYKLLRRKINKALAKEYVSDDTKLMVTAIIDDLMAKIVENQCIWNNPAPSIPISFRSKKGGKSELRDIATTWSKAWNGLKSRQSRSMANAEDREKFFNDFEKFVGIMVRDMETLSQNYKVVCKVVNQAGVELIMSKPASKSLFSTVKYEDKDPSRTLPDNDPSRTLTDKDKLKQKVDITIDGSGKCANFKICSEELIEFLRDVHKTLNNTAVMTLRNYAEMFKQDVNPSGKFEKNNITGLIYSIADKAESIVELVFKRQVLKFKIESKHTDNNRIEALETFVQNTILEAKNNIAETANNKLKYLRLKLYETINKDVNVNLNVDLSNLENELNGRICTIFQTCNGRYIIGRRSENMPYLNNKSGIYVKVQLTLDDEVKDGLSKKIHTRRRMGSNKTVVGRSRRVVTRTSPIVWITKTTSSSILEENRNADNSINEISNTDDNQTFNDSTITNLNNNGLVLHKPNSDGDKKKQPRKSFVPERIDAFW